MLKTIVQDESLYVCVAALIFLLWYLFRTKDKDAIYFISADILYIFGELCFDLVSIPLNLPIDFIFFFFVYFFIFLFFKQRTKNLLKNPTIWKNTQLKTCFLLFIDFFIIAILSFLIFYYFDRFSLSSGLVIKTFNYGMTINLIYPVLDFVMLGYYINIETVYITTYERVYVPLTASALIWTIGDFLFAFEEMFQVKTHGIGEYLQIIGLVMLFVILFLIKCNDKDFNYTTIDLYQNKSKFCRLTLLINCLIIAFLLIYLYCIINFSSSPRMNPVREWGIILLVLSISRQNFINFDIQKQLNVLSNDAQTDPLTRLYSRKYAFSMMQSIYKSSLYFNISVSALLLDIDHFKKINDTWGHTFGDYVLINISKIIKNSIETSNIVCRYGGEEILIFLPGIGQNDGKLIAEKIRKDIESIEFKNDRMKSATKITVSIGGSTSDSKTKNEFDLFEKADIALYKAKETRNKTFWFSFEDVIEKSKCEMITEKL